MRVAAVVLLILAAFFTINAAASALYAPYRTYLKNFRTEIFPTVSNTQDSTSVSESTENTSSDRELARSIERMAAGLDAIAATTKTGSGNSTLSGTQTP
jgi:hypothetical protein